MTDRYTSVMRDKRRVMFDNATGSYLDIEQAARHLNNLHDANDVLVARVSEARQALVESTEMPWIWSDVDDNDLDTMGRGMQVRILAGQLRDLLDHVNADSRSLPVRNRGGHARVVVNGHARVVEIDGEPAYTLDVEGEPPLEPCKHCGWLVLPNNAEASHAQDCTTREEDTVI